MQMKHKVSDNVKIEIVHELIEPSYKEEVKQNIEGKKRWKRVGQLTETLSKIFVAVSGIISFSAGYLNNPVLAFVSGTMTTISLMVLQFSSFSYNQNKKQSAELNAILQKLNVDTMPVVDRNPDLSFFVKNTPSPNSKDHIKLSTPPVFVQRTSIDYVKDDIYSKLEKLSEEVMNLSVLVKQMNHIISSPVSSQNKVEEFKEPNEDEHINVRKRNNSPLLED